ncbi:MAG: hypothetical protein OXC03_01170 [Flavobacteriaceae bacterium]|nr:hypothetical protein [Flavobacteriaceae bacterium]
MAGKSYRKGISLSEISQIFAKEEQSIEWLENKLWTKGMTCPFCKEKKEQTAQGLVGKRLTYK